MTTTHISIGVCACLILFYIIYTIVDHKRSKDDSTLFLNAWQYSHRKIRRAIFFDRLSCAIQIFVSFIIITFVIVVTVLKFLGIS